ncbi:FAD-dependent oxidoreductase [Rubellicoccus peritrichatus]|uniref:FAD-dependent oxidoreductase n=1 Tax=Rubellicoccus peritrichatus TaxID=3080537 RepID=A0AAQ3LF28_9BACT|nr:FAD-dependent oxidoreductase [Puniceicoccus sp. CR14]WOO42508.1 FAD-dependent oxidoreductase [Puniceicoccus sp. CR14]
MLDCDYLIIGQGLAGSLLAWELIATGKSVYILDDGHLSASSKVAAGMINPLAGKRLALYPETDAFLERAKYTYTNLREKLGQTFFHELPILRLLQDEAESTRYEDRKLDSEFDSYLGGGWMLGSGSFALGDELGGFMTCRSGWVDVPALISALRTYFTDADALIPESFTHSDLLVGENTATWRGEVRAQQVVFCEGWKGRDNPWFDWLPWDPVKGEILSLDIKGIPRDRILNRGKWLVPGPAGTFRAGSTYTRDSLDLEPTREGQSEILFGLSKLLPNLSYQVVDHLAGIRPGSRTQHPLIGRHPKFPQLGLFNGFGSKGALLIPLCSKHLVSYFSSDIPLPPKVDIHNRWPT